MRLPTDSPASMAPSPDESFRRKTVTALVGVAFIAFAAARLLVFPWAENLYGDAAVRSELAERWAQSPHLIRSFYDGTYQFGPLHLYWMGAFLKAWSSREDATRLASLVAALLTLIPVLRIARRLFSPLAGLATLLALAVWCLHIQASTTAGSEAFFLALIFFSLDALTVAIDPRHLAEAARADLPRWRTLLRRDAPLVVAALFANLFCATRYDGWMYAPLLGLAVAFGPGRRPTRFARAAFFLALCAPWPLWWCYQSWRATGDPLFAIHYIDEFHRTWTRDGVEWLGATRFRLLALGFWPGTLLVTASPLVGLWAIAGMIRAVVRREKRLMVLLAVVPAVYYTVRGALLLNFSPLARFAMVQVALALFYVAEGFEWLCGRWSRRAQAWAIAAAAALAVATPLWLGHFTAWRSGGWRETLRPITPLSTIPVAQHQAAALLRERLAPDEAVVLDLDAGYADLNVAFFSGLPEERMIRRRWPDFDAHLGWAAKPDWLVAFEDGRLSRDGLKVGEARAAWQGREYQLVAAPGDGLYVYRRVPPQASADPSPERE